MSFESPRTVEGHPEAFAAPSWLSAQAGPAWQSATTSQAVSVTPGQGWVAWNTLLRNRRVRGP